MKILIVATVNGLQNEGMRNVITHFSKSLEKEHEVSYAALTDIGAIRSRAKSCHMIIVCARGNAKVYLLCQLLRFSAKTIFILLVQKPEIGFIKLNNVMPLKCNYLTIYKKDIENLRLSKTCKTYEISVGIDQKRFRALSSRERTYLKQKYGFDTVRPVILHVGHCSTGRGLEDFCKINQKRYQCVVVASGLFEDKEVVDRLRKAGVRLLIGFLPSVEEIYQLADVYLFPTKTTDFVISIPLSVMEALSCGTPVVAYRQLFSLSYIRTNKEQAFSLIESTSELVTAVENAVLHKSEETLLSDCRSWDESAQQVLNILKG